MIKHAVSFIASALFVLIAVLLTVVSPATGAESPKVTSERVAPDANDAKPVTVAAGRRQLIERAVEELTAEAIDVGKYKDAKISPHFGRPHPVLGGLGPDMALDVLDRMLEPFAGNAYEDTYIRWHLMHVIKKASQSDRRQMGPRLVKLVKQMPETLGISERPEFRNEPQELANEFFRIFESLRVIIGYPPYEKRINPPASFAHMPPERRAEAEALWKKAQEIKSRYKTITDPDAIAFNRRIQEVNWIVRQYRGELIYAMFFTGDPEMVDLMVSTLNAHAKKRSGIAFDLLAFGYLAVFDGALDLYEPTLLNELSRKLKSVARSNDQWIDYKRRKRNFADSAFHLISLLEDGGGFTDLRPATTAQPPATSATPPDTSAPVETQASPTS